MVPSAAAAVAMGVDAVLDDEIGQFDCNVELMQASGFQP